MGAIKVCLSVAMLVMLTSHVHCVDQQDLDKYARYFATYQGKLEVALGKLQGLFAEEDAPRKEKTKFHEVIYVLDAMSSVAVKMKDAMQKLVPEFVDARQFSHAEECQRSFGIMINGDRGQPNLFAGSDLLRTSNISAVLDRFIRDYDPNEEYIIHSCQLACVDVE